MLIVCFSFNGCSRVGNIDVVAETEEKHYQRAQRLLREGREQEALIAFLKVVEKRRDAPESHLEAGRLYASYIGDPLAAIYHYRKFLELKPNGKQAPMVKQLVETATKAFARQLPGQPLGDQADRLDLLSLLEEMRKENILLKKQLGLLQAELAEFKQARELQASNTVAMNVDRMQSMPMASQPRRQAARPQVVQAPTSQQPAPPATPASYLVESGDSLYSISKKVYGSPARYMDIFQANRDQMPSPDALRVGMTLRIPK